MRPAVTAELKPAKSKADVSANHVDPVASAVELEAAYGGAAAGMPLFLASGLQCKLFVGAVDDPLEREADQIADMIMRTREGKSPSPGVSDTVSGVQRECSCQGSTAKCDKCQEDEQILQRSVSTPTADRFAPASVHDALRSPGQPLDPGTRSFMQPRFGRDFSGVRVHTDSNAADSAKEIHARAYTAGQDIVFAQNQFSPTTSEGRSLLAHELAHVVQQSRGTIAIHRGPDDKKEERQGPITETEERILEVANKRKIYVGIQVKIEVSGDPVEGIGATFSYDKKKAKALGGTGKAAVLPPLDAPKWAGAKAGIQPSSGVIIEPPKGSNEVEILAWNTGDPIGGSTVSHAEAQFEDWFHSRDPKWKARVKSVTINVFGRDICEGCEGRLTDLKKAYGHIDFKWARGDSGAALENFKMRRKKKAQDGPPGGGSPVPSGPAVVPSTKPPTSPPTTEAAKPPSDTKPVKPAPATEPVKPEPKPSGDKPTSTTKPADTSAGSPATAESQRLASRGIQGINSIANLTNVHGAQELGQAAAREAANWALPRVMRAKAIYDTVKLLYVAWGTDDFWIAATELAYSWILDALGPLGAATKLAYESHFHALGYALAMNQEAGNFEKSVKGLEAGANQFEELLDKLSTLDSALPIPGELGESDRLFSFIPLTLDAIDEYWHLASEMAKAASNARRRLNEILEYWDHLVALAVKTEDVTRTKISTAITDLDWSYHKNGAGFRAFVVRARERATTFERWANVRAIWAGKLLQEADYFGKYFRRSWPASECLTRLEDDPDRLVQECVMNRWGDWVGD